MKCVLQLNSCLEKKKKKVKLKSFGCTVTDKLSFSPIRAAWSLTKQLLILLRKDLLKI